MPICGIFSYPFGVGAKPKPSAPMTQPEANSEAPAAEEAPAQAEQSAREESPSPEEASQTAEEDKAE